MTNAKSQKEIRQIVDAYFHQTPHRVTLNMAGNIASLEICYTDFKPTRQVRRELEDLIPNLDTCTLYREFSPEVESDAIDEANTKYNNIYIKDERSGEFIPTAIGIMIEEILFNRCLV